MVTSKKNLFMILAIFSILLLPLTYAQETAKNPGITPDSFFWGLDNAFDQLSLFLTINPEAKSKKGLEIAEERLGEIKLMIEENKLEAAQKSKESHKKVLIKVKESVSDIQNDNSEEELRGVIEVETDLENHIEDVKNTFSKIKIEIEGDLTEEQKLMIDDLLNNLQDQTGKAKLEIKIKKDETRVKIKQKTSKTDQEIDNGIEKVESELGLSKIEVKAEIKDDVSEIKLEKEFSTSTIDKQLIITEIISEFSLDFELADSLLELKTEDDKDDNFSEKLKIEVDIDEGVAEIKIELRYLLESIDRSEILNSIVKKSKLTMEQVESVIEFEDDEVVKEENEDDNKDEVEIKVEFEDEVAEIEAKFFGEELEFNLDTTDKNLIILEIIERTGLTRGQVESVIEFEDD